MKVTAHDKSNAELTEIYIWSLIEEIGGFTWRMNHDMADGRIPQESHAAIDEDIVRMTEIQKYAVSQLPRFGVANPEMGPEEREKYFEWYQGWKGLINGLSEAEWQELNSLLGKNDPKANEYHPNKEGVSVKRKIDWK